MDRKSAGEMDLGVEVGKGMAAKMVQAAFGFAGAIIFARVLGPTGFGGFYLLLSLVELSKRPINGVSTAIQKRYAEANSPREELVGTLVWTSLVALGIVTVGVFTFEHTLVSYTGIQSAPILFVILFAAVANFPAYQNLLTSIGKLGVQTWIDTVRSVLTFAGQLLLVLLGYGAAGMAIGLSVGTFILLPLSHYYLRRLPRMPSKGTIRSVWTFARYSVPSIVVGKAYDRFDILLLGVLATPALAGQYEVAYKLTIPATFIAGLAGSGMMAKISDLHSREESVEQHITNTLAFSSLFAIPMFFGAMAMPRTTIVTVYGPEYRAAALLLIGLLLFRVISSQTSVLGNVVNGLNLPEYQLQASTIALAINIPLGIVLYFEMGALGVVVATVVAETLRYALMYRVIRRRIGATLLPRALLEQLVAGGIMFVIVEFSRQSIIVRSWIEFGLLVAIGVAVYFGVLFALSQHFRITVRSVLGQALGQVNQ